MKSKNTWKPLPDYCFVAPIHNDIAIENKKEKDLFGIIKINNPILEQQGVNDGDLISFTPSSEFEFLVDEQKLYRIKYTDISATYGSQKNKKQYNPSWRKSS